MKILHILGTGAQVGYVLENCAFDYDDFVLIDVINIANVSSFKYGYQIKFYIDDFVKFDFVDTVDIIVALGDVSLKSEIIQKLYKIKKVNIINAINPKSYISKNCTIGKGVIVNQGVSIGRDCEIGDFTIIHSGSTIEHDNSIGNNVNIGPGVTTAGNVTIGSNVAIYTGVTICPKVKITNNVTIGAGSLVLKNIKESGTYYGVPARRIK